VDFAIERGGMTVATATGVTTYGANKTIGSVANPMLVDFSGRRGAAIIYPSPFTDVLYIRQSVAPEAGVTVTVTDMAGRRVGLIDNCNSGDGRVDIAWKEAATLPAGVYMVIIDVDGSMSNYKVIKK
jgi:hypothetical protein